MLESVTASGVGPIQVHVKPARAVHGLRWIMGLCQRRRERESKRAFWKWIILWQATCYGQGGCRLDVLVQACFKNTNQEEGIKLRNESSKNRPFPNRPFCIHSTLPLAGLGRCCFSIHLKVQVGSAARPSFLGRLKGEGGGKEGFAHGGLHDSVAGLR